MSKTLISEDIVEEATIAWLVALGWGVAHGPDIAPNAPNAERDEYGQVILERRLQDSLDDLNPGLPSDALDDAFRRLTRPEGATLEARNRAFHRMLVDGVTVEYRADGGTIRWAQVKAVDFDNYDANDWLAVNQFTVTENRNTRRPDVVLFVNGLPLGVIELKNPADEDATIWAAWQQLQTYRAELPSLFSMNEALMVSDGTEARIGTLTSGREWFKPWRTITGEALGRSPHDRATGDARRRFRAPPLPRARPGLHRFRRRRKRRDGQEDGRVSPVPRRQGCGGRDPAGGEAATRGDAGCRRERAVRVGSAHPAASRATGASGWCGTPRDQARA